MVFEQFQLSGELSKLVSEITYYRDYHPEHEIDRFFPDANAYLMLELNDVAQHTFNDQQQVIGTFHKHWFSGNRTTSMRFNSGEGVEMFVLTFKNAFALPIIHRPMQEFTNEVVQAEFIFGNTIDQLWTDLKNLPDLPGRVQLIQSFFEERLHWDEQSIKWFSIIENLDGRFDERISIEDLVREVGLSQKSLIQQFKRRIGVTPRDFIQLKRFQKFITCLVEESQTKNLTSIMLDCGYFDQSHGIREFRKYAGTTPTEYLKNYTGYDNYMADGG